MNAFKLSAWIILFLSILIFTACGGGGGGDGDSGTATFSVTDAKPLLPDDVTNVFVEFSEVWVHKPGNGWIELPLVESPYTIDLLQFHNGETTELVPPTKLSSGKYTQVRIGVNKATITFDNGGSTEDVTVPSEKLKTDKNFIFNVNTDSAMDIVIHFDLSMSIIVSGTELDPEYKLKPVLHLFQDPLQAATIEGSIVNSSFGDSEKATIIVTEVSSTEEFTRVEIPKSTTTDPTGFSIFWIVPNHSYTVEIDLDPDTEGTIIDCDELVGDFDLPEGAEFELNEGYPIEVGEGICVVD